MHTHCHSTRPRGRHFFTLIELIVTIVILGVLAALAVPALNAVIDRAADDSAVSALQAADREVRAMASFDGQGWLTGDAAADVRADLPDAVSVPTGTLTSAAIESRSGRCFSIRFDAAGGPGYLLDAPAGTPADQGLCLADLSSISADYIRLADSADRGGSQPAAGATVSGQAYVYLDVQHPDISQVTWSLDGSVVQTENVWPYDFAGGGVPGSGDPDANAWDTTAVADGPHTLTAQVTHPSGTATVSVDVTVDNS